MSFKAKAISNDKTGYEFKWKGEDEYNNERPDQEERWGTSEAANEERRPATPGYGKPSTSC